MTSCKRKRSTNKVVKDSGDASLSLSAADELYFDSSGVSSPRKKHKVNDSSRFQQNDDDFSNRAYTDDVQMFGNHNSSEFHINSNTTERGECPHTALASDEKQSSYFEELLFGLLSDNECSQVVSQKSTTAGVKGIKKQVHKAEICRSVSDSSSDCSDMDISRAADHTNNQCPAEGTDASNCDNLSAAGSERQIVVSDHSEICHSVSDSSSDSSDIDISRIADHTTNQCPAEGTAHLDRTSCFFSTGVSSNCDNLSAAGSEMQIVVSDHSVSVKTDLLQSTGKHGNKKPKKLTEVSATLYSESECHEKKPKQAKQHTITCVSPSQMSDNSQYVLLRKVHRTLNMHEAVCDKLSTPATADTVNRCLELNLGSVKNISSGEAGYCDMPKSNKKHKKEGESKEVTDSSTESESSQSLQQGKKRHCELVDNMCSSSDSQSVHSVAVRESVVAKNDSTQITAATGHLDCSTENIEVEPDDDDGCWTLPMSCDKQNELKKQVTVSEIEQHAVPEATAGCAESEVDTINVQAVEQQHQVDSLTEDSICSEMSEEDCVDAAEQNELSSKSATSVTVTASVHTPASPSLYSADEEDEVCSKSSQGEEESADETEEVNSFRV